MNMQLKFELSVTYLMRDYVTESFCRGQGSKVALLQLLKYATFYEVISLRN